MQSITPNIKYIGAEDDNLDLFEGQYPIPNGISYNSYFIIDRHLTIVDAVDKRRCGDWLESIAEALDAVGAKSPEYLIVQHVEPDHAGSIGSLLQRYPDVKVICTAKAASMLAIYFEHIDFRQKTLTVADGDTISLGRTTLQFITAPMVHWPEVMMTLDTSDGILFSADAFGSFAMSTSTEAWDAEARRYYTNIVGRFGSSVRMVMKKLQGLSFNTIAPLHGPVLTDNLAHYWKLYDLWSSYTPESDGVLVAYASIYGGTAQAARRLAAMLEEEGVSEVVLLDLSRHDVSYAVAEAFRFSRMALCSVTYDADIFPAMHDFINHLERKKLCNRRVGLVENGSWAPMAARIMADMLSKMKQMTVVEPVVTIKGHLHVDDFPTLKQLAHALAN